jgi:hypothetical protein
MTHVPGSLVGGRHQALHKPGHGRVFLSRRSGTLCLTARSPEQTLKRFSGGIPR